MKLADFGSARQIAEDGRVPPDVPKRRDESRQAGAPSERLRRRGVTSAVGSLWYLAPELVNDASYGASADLYSFGIALAALFAAPRGCVAARFPRFFKGFTSLGAF